MTADEFRSALAAEFPEVVAAIDPIEVGLLHCEIGRFRTCTEEAIDGGRQWAAERHFRFVERALREADAEVRNALEISYLEDLALGEHKPEWRRVVKERMPAGLRRVLIGHHGWWA